MARRPALLVHRHASMFREDVLARNRPPARCLSRRVRPPAQGALPAPGVPHGRDARAALPAGHRRAPGQLGARGQRGRVGHVPRVRRLAQCACLPPVRGASPVGPAPCAPCCGGGSGRVCRAPRVRRVPETSSSDPSSGMRACCGRALLIACAAAADRGGTCLPSPVTEGELAWVVQPSRSCQRDTACISLTAKTRSVRRGGQRGGRARQPGAHWRR